MKTFALSLCIFAIVVLSIGCDDATTMVKPVIEDHTAAPETEPRDVGMVSQMKEEPVVQRPQEPMEVVAEEETPEPVAPPEPVEVVVTPPTVLEVAYYRDWQLTQPLTGTIRSGTTVYTKVVFSEPMQHTVSDGADALPALSFLINGKPVQYRMQPHGASGEHFQSGDCKPLHGGTDDYLCKYTYTMQADDDRAFTLHAGAVSVSANSIPLTADYTHTIDLTLEGKPKLYELVDGLPTRLNNNYVNPAPALDWKITDVLNGVVQTWTGTSGGYRHEGYVESKALRIRRLFGIPYSLEIEDQIAVIYQEERQLPPTSREYIKLSVTFPEKRVDEILDDLRESVRSGVDYDLVFRDVTRRFTLELGYLYQPRDGRHKLAGGIDPQEFSDLVTEVYGFPFSVKTWDFVLFELRLHLDQYLRYALEFPEKTEDEIIDLLREFPRW